MTTPKGWDDSRFVPATRAISIGGGVIYRPLRSWHTGVYAGERLTVVDGDRSGCLYEDEPRKGLTTSPKSYTHRIYWNPDVPAVTVSAFLSYPHGMGVCDGYFWEAMLNREGGPDRFGSEEECEAAIRELLSSAQPEGKER